MIEWLSKLNIDDRISFLPVIGLGLLLLVVPFYGGGNEYTGEALLFLLTGPITYFAWRSNREVFEKVCVRPTSLFLFLLVLSMAVSLSASADRVTSFINLLHWISFYVIFISASVVVDSRERFAFLSGATILSGVALALIGFWGLLTTDSFSYLRLASVFNEHNAFAGFLILPLVLSAGRLVSAKTKEQCVLWGAAAAIIGSAFVLTFSRGSWLGLAVGAVVAGIAYRKPFLAYLGNKAAIVSLGWVALLIFALVFGALKITSHQAAAQNQSVGVFTGETLAENAITARLHYYQDALTVIAANPIYGVGLRHYGEAVKLYKDTPAFYASSPHNEYLQLIAEIGIVGGLLFILFAVLVALALFRSLKTLRSTDEWPQGAALLAGVLGVLVYMCTEVGWGYVANPLLFFAIVGAAYGSLGIQELSLLQNAVRAGWVRIAVVILMLIAGALSLVGAVYWYQSYHLEWGLMRANEERLPEALIELREANRFGDFDFSPHYFAAVVLERQSHTTPNRSEQQQFLASALKEINAAIERKPQKPLFFSWQSLIYKEMNNEDGYRQALETTIRFNPVEAVYEYQQLATLYNAEKQYQKTIDLSEQVLPYYPLALWNNPYWVNPDRQTVWQQIADIYKQVSIAQQKLGNKTAAKQAFDTAKTYDPAIAP